MRFCAHVCGKAAGFLERSPSCPDRRSPNRTSAREFRSKNRHQTASGNSWGGYPMIAFSAGAIPTMGAVGSWPAGWKATVGFSAPPVRREAGGALGAPSEMASPPRKRGTTRGQRCVRASAHRGLCPATSTIWRIRLRLDLIDLNKLTCHDQTCCSMARRCVLEVRSDCRQSARDRLLCRCWGRGRHNGRVPGNVHLNCFRRMAVWHRQLHGRAQRALSQLPSGAEESEDPKCPEQRGCACEGAASDAPRVQPKRQGPLRDSGSSGAQKTDASANF